MKPSPFTLKRPTNLFSLIRQVDKLYQELNCLRMELGQLIYIPTAEQTEHLLALSAGLDNNGVVLKQLEILINEQLNAELPEKSVYQLEILAHQLTELLHVHLCLSVDSRRLKHNLTNMNIDYII